MVDIFFVSTYTYRMMNKKKKSKENRQIPKLTDPERVKFYMRIDSHGLDECWPWTGGSGGGGYGVFCISAKPYRAHRISYSHFVGTFPPVAIVMHSCDNPACVNPRHLFLGTNKMNSRDMVQKSRYRRSVLSTEDVISIRKGRASGKTLKQLSKRYGVSDVAIHKIVMRKSYKNIP